MFSFRNQGDPNKDIFVDRGNKTRRPFSTKETTVGLSHPSPGSLWDCQAQGYEGRKMKGSGHVTGPELEGTRGRLDLALPSMTVKVLAMVTAIAPSALAGTCPAPHVLVFCAVPQQPI